MQPLNYALLVPPVLCRLHAVLISQYRRTFIPLSVSLWNDLVDPVFDGVGLAGFQCRVNTFSMA